MTETVLALLITALMLIGMAMFVPLVVLAERLLKTGAQTVVLEPPEECEFVTEASQQPEAV